MHCSQIENVPCRVRQSYSGPIHPGVKLFAFQVNAALTGFRQTLTKLHFIAGVLLCLALSPSAQASISPRSHGGLARYCAWSSAGST